MSWIHVKALLKLSIFFLLFFLIQGGLAIVFGYFIGLPTIHENIHATTEFFVYEQGLPPNMVLLEFLIGILVLTGIIICVSVYISYKIVEIFLNWNDVKQVLPKLWSEK